MNKQPACGCSIPIINPPDFGMGARLPVGYGESPVPIVYPLDPSEGFPRVLTASADTRQSTSLACEPAAPCGFSDGRGCSGRLISRAHARYVNEGLNLAEREIASLLAKVHYPIPGIWLGPAYIHMPSGNLVLQVSAPRCGPLDPVPVFTYNSLAARDKADFGHGISDLFNPTIEEMDGNQANIITGTGRYLVYTNVQAGAWATAPNSTRNALMRTYDLTWIERQPDGLEWHYFEGGCLEKIVTPQGQEWTISRDGAVVTITAPNGRVTTYSPAGVIQPGSRVTQFTISGDLFTGVTYPDGAVWTFAYSGRLLIRVTDPEGHVTAYDYDHLDRVKGITTAENASYHFKYFQEENEYGEEEFWIEVTDPAQEVTTVMHDCNVVTEVIDPLGHRTTYVWEGSADPRMSAIIDPNGHQTSLGYTPLTNGTRGLLTIDKPSVGTFYFDYGSDGRCSAITDYDGHSTQLAWDDDENRKSVLDAENKRFTFLYNSVRQVKGTIDPLTNRTTTLYDSAGNPESLANENNEITVLTYNTPGEATAVTDPETETTTYGRDNVGRITAVTDPNTNTVSFEYDDDGLLELVENAEEEATRFEYDGEHRLKKLTDPLNHETLFSYDYRGNLEYEEDAEGALTRHEYDAASRRIRTINSLGNTYTYDYDPVGNRTAATNPENEKTTYVYDDNNRLKA